MKKQKPKKINDLSQLGSVISFKPVDEIVFNEKPILSIIVEKEQESRQKFNNSYIDQYRAKYGLKIMRGNDEK